MKKNIFRSCSAALVVAAGILAAAFPAAGQSILITINDSNPSAVTFTATGAHPGNSGTSTIQNLYGVTLTNFLTSVQAASGAVTGNLTPESTVVAYNAWAAVNTGLNLYVNNISQAQAFNNSAAAFTGTATVNLSSIASSLPIGFATGNIYSGDNRSPTGVLIGTWTVPEPPVEAQLALGALGFAGLALFRRARRAAASR